MDKKSLHCCLMDLMRNYEESISLLEKFVEQVQKSIGSQKDSHSFWTDFLLPVIKENPNSDYIEASRDGMNVKMSRTEAINKLNRMEKELQPVLKFPDLLMEMSFIYLVAVFDAFLLDTLQSVFNFRPEMLKSKKQLTYHKIIELHTDGALMQYIAEREINEFGYKSINDQALFIAEKFNIEVDKSGVALTELIEIRAIRNLLVHNRGRVNQIYIETVKGTKYQEGERIEITIEYWKSSGEKINKISKYLCEEFIQKFR